MSEKDIERFVTWIDLSGIELFDFNAADAEQLNSHLEEPFKVVYDYEDDRYFLIEVSPDE